ncbi:MAG: restriction endonuclease, partial [Flavobacteriales bacterium]|nr:restriction endonuclease [Flavobacteriales bacterium]
DWKEGNIIASASQLFKFYKVFEIGDYVVTYDRISRKYLIGTIDSGYKYDDQLMEYFHTRKVVWVKEKSRDELSTYSKNTLGSTLTIFEINSDVASDLIDSTPPAKIVEESESVLQDEDLDEIKDETIERANEFIKDKIANLSWDKMQDFVAGLLRAMGYITQVSPKGPDRGKDIIASPDGLGLEEPRIKVEVKHRKGQMGAPDIRSFIGSIRSEKGLYVSTGGFTREAKYEAERSDKPVTLLDLDGLVGISIQYYDKFDNEAKSILPLKKVYWPL